MKILVIFVLTISVIASCSKENGAPTVLLNEMKDSTAMVTRSGRFMNGPYGSVMGNVKIYNNNNAVEVLLDSFSTNNGPDLYVYLSKEIMPANFVSLGKLKSTMGSQVYVVPANTIVADYKYICIHCQQYNHLFGYALIQ